MKTLEAAGWYLTTLYFKCTDKVPTVYADNDTLVYANAEYWIDTEDELYLFLESVLRTIRKYPNHSASIASHLINIPDIFYLKYYREYFKKLVDNTGVLNS